MFVMMILTTYHPRYLLLPISEAVSDRARGEVESESELFYLSMCSALNDRSLARSANLIEVVR